MKTDYKNINSFEAAVVGMIAVGFVIVGIVLFATLTPRQQVNVVSAFDVFDLHQQTIATTSLTLESVTFVWNIPTEFYNQFYIAFTEVATLPEQAVEMPILVAKELSRNISVAIDNLADQASRGYMSQAQYHNQNSEMALLPYDGKIMGAMIEVSDKLSNMTVVERNSHSSLKMYYDYVPPKIFSELK